MKTGLSLGLIILICLGSNSLAQTFLPDSEVNTSLEAGGKKLRLVIHPVGGEVFPSDKPYSDFAEYDIFVATNPAAGISNLYPNDWSWIRRTKPGETNLVFENIWQSTPKFIFGTMVDSDNDQLPDAFEMLVSKTNPHKYDSANDGVSDGEKIGVNGLPWELEQFRRSEAVIFARSNNATEGGACGQCVVYLPEPAPSGGETVHYYLGGMAVPGEEFTITPSIGSWNDYSFYIPAGSDHAVMSVSAMKTKKYHPYNRYTVITLSGSKNFRVNSFPALVNILDTNLPNVLVYALPPLIDAPLRVYGTNHVEFMFVRGGKGTSDATIEVELKATAAFWNGRAIAKASIRFPAGQRTFSLPVILRQYKVDKAYDSIILKIASAPGYQIDPTNGVAGIQIVNHDFIFQHNIEH